MIVRSPRTKRAGARGTDGFGVGVAVSVRCGVIAGVGFCVGVAAGLGVTVGVGVRTGVAVGMLVGVAVEAGVGVITGPAVDTGVEVGAGVVVGTGVSVGPAQASVANKLVKMDKSTTALLRVCLRLARKMSGSALPCLKFKKCSPSR